MDAVLNKPKLLIVDDEETIRSQMKWALVDEYEISLAVDRASAVDSVKREHPSIVTLDLGLPPRPREVDEGFAALDDVLEADAGAKVIVITGRGEKQHALRAIGRGAYDFLSKPVDIAELKVILRRAAEVSRLEAEHRELEQRVMVESFD